MDRALQLSRQRWLLLGWALAGCASATGASGGDAEATAPDATTGVHEDAASGVDAATSVMSAQQRCLAIERSVTEAGFGGKVAVSCDDRYAHLVSDTDPDHPKMNGIVGTNDQVPVPAPQYSSPVALVPVRARTMTSIDAALGIAVNGVPIYDYTSQGNNDLSAYDPRFDTKLTGELDLCNGHAGRGDDYHYHAAPTCMIAAMANRGSAAILGWGFDGYPIYGDNNPDGSAIGVGELDVCNSKADPVFGARYHTSQGHPYILQCLVGEVDLTAAPRVPPLSNAAGGGKAAGMKPPGGVTNLQLVEAPDGTRTMTYDHGGQSYSIQYRPSAQQACWDFEERSYSTGGAVVRSTYCRSTQ